MWVFTMKTRKLSETIQNFTYFENLFKSMFNKKRYFLEKMGKPNIDFRETLLEQIDPRSISWRWGGTTPFFFSLRRLDVNTFFNDFRQLVQRNFYVKFYNRFDDVLKI